MPHFFSSPSSKTQRSITKFFLKMMVDIIPLQMQSSFLKWFASSSRWHLNRPQCWCVLLERGRQPWGSCAGDCPVPWVPSYTCNTISFSLLVTGTCWPPKLMDFLVCSSVSSVLSDPFLPDWFGHLICWVLSRPQHTFTPSPGPHCLFCRSPVISPFLISASFSAPLGISRSCPGPMGA